MSKQRLYAFLLALGAAILLFRTVLMLAQGYLSVLVWWASGLLILEFLIDLSCLTGSLVWGIMNDKKYRGFSLRMGAAAALLHAFRVLVYVLGRVGPWAGFDVQPEHRVPNPQISWGWLYFAAIMSVLGVIGVAVIWYLMRRSKES